MNIILKGNWIKSEKILFSHKGLIDKFFLSGVNNVTVGEYIKLSSKKSPPMEAVEYQQFTTPDQSPVQCVPIYENVDESMYQGDSMEVRQFCIWFEKRLNEDLSLEEFVHSKHPCQKLYFRNRTWYVLVYVFCFDADE